MLHSLERQSGLPLAFDPETNEIHWPDMVSVASTNQRSAHEMREYIRDPEAAAERETIYSVWRGVARTEDAERIRAEHLRYDITVIPPGRFAGDRREFFRTAGHYHPQKSGTAVAYLEVYEVLSGRAYWLIQQPRTENSAIIEEIYAIEAGPGAKAIMLPGFGHISVNAFSEPLVMANWIGDAFAYDYEPYRRFRGAGYWVLEGESSDSIEFEANPNYERVPELKKIAPREMPELGLVRSRPLYALARDLEKLRFLNSPEEFTALLTLDRCYRPGV